MPEKTELMTTEELRSLRKELRSNYFLGVAFFFMAYMLIHLVIYANTEKWIIPGFELVIMFGSLFTMLLLAFIFSQQLRKEIEDGTKIIEYLIIEDKHSYIDRHDRLSTEFTKYVIIAGDKKFTVTEELYKTAEISDSLLVHKTPKREIELKLEIKKQKT